MTPEHYTVFQFDDGDSIVTGYRCMTCGNNSLIGPDHIRHGESCQWIQQLNAAEARVKELETEKAAGAFWRDVFSVTEEEERAKIENELHDYYFLLYQASRVYMAVTGGKLSKTNYYADVVIAAFEEYLQSCCEEYAADALPGEEPKP